METKTKVSEQLYEMYKAYLPNVGRLDSESSFLESIDHVLWQERYLMSFSIDGKLLGFVESFRINTEQAGILTERSLYEAANPGKFSPVLFDIVRENITDGPVCWVENIAIHFEHRNRTGKGNVFRDLLKQYWQQNRNAEVHMGNAQRKMSGLIKILRKRGI